MKNIKAKKGFTIVELVIVIGVIGILAGILIPTFVNVTQSANEAKLKADLANAFSSYIADAADERVDTPKNVVVGYNETTDADKVYFYEAGVNQNQAILKGSDNTTYAFDEKGWGKFDITVNTADNGVAYYMNGTVKTYVDVAFNGYSVFNRVARN